MVLLQIERVARGLCQTVLCQGIQQMPSHQHRHPSYPIWKGAPAVVLMRHIPMALPKGSLGSGRHCCDWLIALTSGENLFH